MKRIITGCLLLNFAMAAQAECNISSSIQNIDYGKRSAAMRQVDRGKTTQLADIFKIQNDKSITYPLFHS